MSMLSPPTLAAIPAATINNNSNTRLDPSNSISRCLVATVVSAEVAAAVQPTTPTVDITNFYIVCSLAPTSTSAVGQTAKLERLAVEWLSRPKTGSGFLVAGQRVGTLPPAQGQGYRANRQGRVYVANTNKVVHAWQ